MEPTAPSGILVTASAHDGNLPDNVLDADLNTRWSAEGDGQHINLELAQQRALSQLNISFYKGDTRATHFEIQVSVDGSVYSTIFNGSSSGRSLEKEVFSFDEVQALNVKVVGRGNTENNWVSLTEITLGADESAVEIEPETGNVGDSDYTRIFNSRTFGYEADGHPLLALDTSGYSSLKYIDLSVCRG